jgi:hypothetical protein
VCGVELSVLVFDSSRDTAYILAARAVVAIMLATASRLGGPLTAIHLYSVSTDSPQAPAFLVSPHKFCRAIDCARLALRPTPCTCVALLANASDPSSSLRLPVHGRHCPRFCQSLDCPCRPRLLHTHELCGGCMSR